MARNDRRTFGYCERIVHPNAPLPITLATNAASYLNGTVSPGEMIAIFAKGGESDRTRGRILPVPAPLTYVSSTQVNCMVAYEVLRSASVEMRLSYLGHTARNRPASRRQAREMARPASW